MTIVNKLRNLISAKGGSPIGVMTIADGVDKLEKMETAANPLSALLIDTDIGASEDLLGKVVSDLQKDIVVGTDKITGTLKYVTGYTRFSGDAKEQEGNYLAIHASVPEVTGVTIKIKLSYREGEKPLDADGILILRVAEEGYYDNGKLTFTAYKDGCAPISKTFALSYLTLTPKPTT